MFKNSLNAKSGIIKKCEESTIIYGIRYFDRMYRRMVFVNYDNKELRNKDFNNITDYNYSYFKIN